MNGAYQRLSRPIQKWVREQGWSELRDIQSKAIHVVAGSEDDLIVAASTAGGKTEAAFLPLLSQVLDNPSADVGFDLLYIGPLKALITDQAERLEGICRHTDMSVVPWHGDISNTVKAKAIKKPDGVLLITPESLEALFIRRGMEIPRLFGATRAVVIDELHTVLDSERGIQMLFLLTRLELAVKRRIRRVGLSATLGDMDLAKSYLRPDSPSAVQLINADADDGNLLLQLRGYMRGVENEAGLSAENAIAQHLFEKLRGSDNLVFAGARGKVELYADRLGSLCETENLPQEFYAHHANLSREHRSFVEQRLKDARLPTTAVCTSTLELGIDIGDVSCVAQIGAPFSVASLRQRLGRSGRRPGQSAVLRQYAVEEKLTPDSDVEDQLRLGLLRAIAMIELLGKRWYEPPSSNALHLSTLVHQIMSVIAERGGARANRLYRVLCQEGPFRQVSPDLFLRVLRSMGCQESGLIEQSADGLLLLGGKGEVLVDHYSFYAVFNTSEEYRLIAEGRELGVLPVDSIVSAGMDMIFAGRRWTIMEIHDKDRVILLMPSTAGGAPSFGGEPGDIHDRVIEKMFDILEGDGTFFYMDRMSLQMLEEARNNYAHAGFRDRAIVQTGESDYVLQTRCGTVKNSTLALALIAFGFKVRKFDGFLEINRSSAKEPLEKALESIAQGEAVNLFSGDENLIFEKFHPYLATALLQEDALSSRLDKDSLPAVCQKILQAV